MLRLTPRLVRRTLLPASYLVFLASMVVSGMIFYGKSDRRLLSKTDPGDLAGFRGTGSCISFRTVFPRDRWCGKFFREVGSIGRALHLEVKLFRDSRLVDHHSARQAESLGKLRHGPPGVQLPPLDGWSLRPLLAIVSEYIGTSLVSRWNFRRDRPSRSARSMGSFIISLLTASPAFALIW